jgi:DNA-binding NarL/FixJ family response regulator
MINESHRPRHVLIVDDHPLVREGLALLLEEEGFAPCCQAEGGAHVAACLGAFSPDLAMVDLSLGDESGLALITELRARGVPVLVYSMHEDPSHVERAFAADAQGYVTKREVSKTLVQAIRAVLAGRRFVSPRAAQGLAGRLADQREHDPDRELSDQERQVYHRLGEGDTTAEIAVKMHLSPRTVESYYDRILTKLDLPGMNELRHDAIQHAREGGAP